MIAEKQEGQKEDELSHRYCPECGTPLEMHPIPIIQSEGVGPTYLQSMRPFKIVYEIVCPKCGLVLGQEVVDIHK